MGPDPAGDAWEGMKFEPYGRTLAKMLGTLLKVPCEARGRLPLGCLGCLGGNCNGQVLVCGHSGHTASEMVWEHSGLRVGKGRTRAQLGRNVFFLLAQTGTSQKVMPTLVRLSGKPDCWTLKHLSSVIQSRDYRPKLDGMLHAHHAPDI
jgi:hypothetical protein